MPQLRLVGTREHRRPANRERRFGEDCRWAGGPAQSMSIPIPGFGKIETSPLESARSTAADRCLGTAILLIHTVSILRRGRGPCSRTRPSIVVARDRLCADIADELVQDDFHLAGGKLGVVPNNEVAADRVE